MRETRATSLGELPFQVDVSSRDYVSLRSSLISFIDKIAPEWTDRYPGDPGMVLLEMVAYVGDVLNYAVDKAQNEAYLPTAQELTNVRNILRLIDYELKNGTGSSVPMCVITEQNNITLPAGTKFTGAGGSFELLSDVDLPVAGIYCPSSVASQVSAALGLQVISADTLVAYFGSQVNERVGISDGSALQSFDLSQEDVSLTSEIAESIRVTTSDNVSWDLASSFVDSDADSTTYVIETFGNQQVRIKFGDGISGKIPAVGSGIDVSYRTGTGTVTNSFGPNTLKTMTPSIAGVRSVFNPVAPSGGKDPESIEDARVNGPRSLRALDRAVTLGDFEALAIQTPGGGVKVARASSDEPYDVTVYIAAEGANPIPTGTWFPRLETGTGLLGAVGRYLSDRKPVATTLAVKKPVAVTPRLTAQVRAFSNFHNSEVQSSVRSALLSLFTDSSTFGKSIPLSRVVQIIENVRGVDFVGITEFRRDPSFYYLQGSESSLVGAALGVSGTSDATRSYRYRVIWLNTSQYQVEIIGYGYASTRFMGKPLTFDAGQVYSIYTYPSSEDLDTASRFKQFDLRVTLGANNPQKGDIWGFANDSVVGSLVLGIDEIIVPSLNAAQKLDSLVTVNVSGGI